MKSINSLVRVSRVLALLALAAATMGAARPADAADASIWPSRVTAEYRILFNGFDIGVFRWQSVIHDQTYSATGDANISAALGAFTWEAHTRSAGKLETMPRPAGFTYDFNGSGRSGSVKMSFTNDAVSSVVAVPPLMLKSGMVPLREQHLKDVLDPLTAVMAMSRANGPNPCGRKLAIFDGRQRFDLAFTYRRQERVTETYPSGQPTIAFVCRVRYIPIAGHKINDETKAMSQNFGVEVSLRPVPSANLLVPYKISIPTAAGTAELVAQRVDIETPGRRQIALVH